MEYLFFHFSKKSSLITYSFLTTCKLTNMGAEHLDKTEGQFVTERYSTFQVESSKKLLLKIKCI